MGRPSSFTPEVLEEITDRLSNGEPLAVICRDDHMPSDRTVRNWMVDMELMALGFDVASAIARARELGFDAIAANVRLTARGQGESTADVQRDKLIIDTDLKLLAKWDPKRYGEKIQTEHSGGVEVKQVAWQIIDPKSPGA